MGSATEYGSKKFDWSSWKVGRYGSKVHQYGSIVQSGTDGFLEQSLVRRERTRLGLIDFYGAALFWSIARLLFRRH